MSVVLLGSTSGSITLQEPAIAGTTTLNLPASSGNVVVDSATQTLTNKTIQGGQWTSPSGSTITSGTSVASTSGTSIDFTGIPSWVKRITVMLNAVSTSGTSNMIVQLGTSGGITTTGYNASGSYISNAVGSSNSSTGFMIQYGTAASNLINGIVLITNITGNQWVESATLGRSDSAATHTSGGVVSLSATLNSVRITTVNGTDTFDAGSINILYE